MKAKKIEGSVFFPDRAVRRQAINNHGKTLETSKNHFVSEIANSALTRTSNVVEEILRRKDASTMKRDRMVEGARVDAAFQQHSRPNEIFENPVSIIPSLIDSSQNLKGTSISKSSALFNSNQNQSNVNQNQSNVSITHQNTNGTVRATNGSVQDIDGTVDSALSKYLCKDGTGTDLLAEQEMMWPNSLRGKSSTITRKKNHPMVMFRGKAAGQNLTPPYLKSKYDVHERTNAQELSNMSPLRERDFVTWNAHFERRYAKTKKSLHRRFPTSHSSNGLQSLSNSVKNSLKTIHVGGRIQLDNRIHSRRLNVQREYASEENPDGSLHEDIEIALQAELEEKGTDDMDIEEKEKDVSDYHLPGELSDSIMCRTQLIEDLQNRILELKNEKKALAKHYDHLKKERNTMKSSEKQMNRKIDELQKECLALQRLKFGRIIDLDNLDKMSISQKIKDKQKQTRLLEMRFDRNRIERERKLNEKKKDLLQSTQDNTKLLRNIAELTKEKQLLEDQLDSSVKEMRQAGRGPQMQVEYRERNRLIQLVKVQAKEVDALKAEINMLRRKTGHLYTPH